LARQFERGGFDVQCVGSVDIYVSWASVSATKRKKKTETQASTLDDFELPSFINLKKAANQWR